MDSPDVAAGPGGALAVTYRKILTRYRARVAVRPAGAPAFEAPETMPGGDQAVIRTQVAIGGDGHVVAGWVDGATAQVRHPRAGRPRVRGSRDARRRRVLAAARADAAGRHRRRLGRLRERPRRGAPAGRRLRRAGRRSARYTLADRQRPGDRGRARRARRPSSTTTRRTARSAPPTSARQSAIVGYGAPAAANSPSIAQGAVADGRRPGATQGRDRPRRPAATPRSRARPGAAPAGPDRTKPKLTILTRSRTVKVTRRTTYVTIKVKPNEPVSYSATADLMTRRGKRIAHAPTRPYTAKTPRSGHALDPLTLGSLARKDLRRRCAPSAGPTCRST